jgi:hypothetical protein
VEAVIKSFFTEVKEGRLEDAQKCVVPGGEYTKLISNLKSGDYEDIMKLVLSKMEYRIVDVSVEGSTAVAEVHIQSVDLYSFYNKYNETLNPMLKVYLSGKAAEKEKAIEQIKEFVLKKIPEDIDSGNYEKSEGDISVNLVMKDGQWLINADENFLNYLTGNMTRLMK